MTKTRRKYFSTYVEIFRRSLERLNKNGWEGDVSGVFKAIEAFQTQLQIINEPIDILGMAKTYLETIDIFSDIAFYMVQQDFSFSWVECNESILPKMDIIIKREVESNRFQQALKSNKNLIVQCFESTPNHPTVLLHGLQTRTQSLGVFVGCLENYYKKRNPVLLNLVSVMIVSIANGLESQMLNQKLLLQNQKLEEAVADRTKELQETNEALEKSKKAAEMASRSKSRFIANISHEIRTPMNAILGFSELLQEDLKDPNHQRYLNSILSSGKTLLQLINDILDLSKIDSGNLQIHYEPFCLKFLLVDMINLFEWRLKKKSLNINFFEIGNIPGKIFLDELRLRQILLNLISNAIKFTETGNITLSVNSQLIDKSYLFLSIAIKDTGIGIPSDQQERIFEPFTQQIGQKYKNFAGTGLGLSISKRLVKLMDGVIELKSKPHKGSTFKIIFHRVKYFGKSSVINQKFSLEPKSQTPEPKFLIETEPIDEDAWQLLSLSVSPRVKTALANSNRRDILQVITSIENIKTKNSSLHNYLKELKNAYNSFDVFKMDHCLKNFEILKKRIQPN